MYVRSVALEQQKLEYERQFEQLRSAMSPSAPGPLGGLDGGRRGPSLYSPLAQSRLEQWARDRSVAELGPPVGGREVQMRRRQG